MMKQEEIQKTVRERYGKIAKESNSGCCGGSCTTSKISPCCGNSPTEAENISKKIGYTDADLQSFRKALTWALAAVIQSLWPP